MKKIYGVFTQITHLISGDLNSSFRKYIALGLVVFLSGLSAKAQSNHTVTFTGASTDFNATEKLSAAANSTDYYVTFDATNLYIGAFRTTGTFGSTDNLSVFVDTDPNATATSGTGTTTAYVYNSVTATLPFTANYGARVEQSYQEQRTYSGSWSAATSPTVFTNTTAREIVIPWTALSSPDGINLTMWMGYGGGIFSNVPGTNVAASGTPTIVSYFGTFCVKNGTQGGVNPINVISTPAPAVSTFSTGTIPAGTYGNINITGSCALAGNVQLAPGAVINVNTGTLSVGTSYKISRATQTNNTLSNTITVNSTLAFAPSTAVVNEIDVNTITVATGGSLTATTTNSVSPMPLTCENFNLTGTGAYTHAMLGSSTTGASTDLPGTTSRSFSSTSTVAITKWANAGTPVALPSGVTYGNLTINVASLAGSWNQSAGITNIAGTLTVTATGGGTLEFRLTGNTALTASIGNLVVNGGILGLSSGTGTTTVTVPGTYTQGGGTLTLSEGAATVNLNITGAFSQTAGTINGVTSGIATGNITTSSTAAVAGTINLAGSSSAGANSTFTVGTNLTISGSGSILLEPNSSSTTGVGAVVVNGNYTSSGTGTPIGFGSPSSVNLSGNFVTIKGNYSHSSTGTYGCAGGTSGVMPNYGFVFAGSGTQTYSETGTVSTYGSFTVNSGSTLQLLTNITVPSGTYPPSLIAINGTIDCGLFQVTGGSSANSTFNLASGATLKTANTSGVVSTTVGSVVTSGFLSTTFNTAANYVFNGTSAQTTNFSATTMANLTIANSAGVTLSAGATVNGLLTMTSGLLKLSTFNLTMGSTSTVSVAASLTSYVATNSTGSVIEKSVTTVRSVPIGTLTNYGPLTLTNTGTSCDYTCSVSTTIPGTVADATKIVNLAWNVVASSSSNTTAATFGWSTASEAASFNHSASCDLGIYNGTIYTATNAGTPTLLGGTSYGVTIPTTLVVPTTTNVWVLGNTASIVATPTITLSSNTIAAGNIAQGVTSNPIYSFAIGVTTSTASLTGLNITTTGSYASADLTNLKVWYQTSAQGATFTGGGTLLSTLTTPGVAGIKTFPTFTSQTIASGATGYIFITADIPCAATTSNTIAVNAVTASNTTFASGTPTGTPAAGNTQTVSAATPNNLVTRAASVLPTSTVITWTAPTGCYSDVMIVVSPAANTGGTPSGGAYSGASLTYGSGTAFGNGYIVYEGTTSSQTVTGLTVGNTYYVKFFTRNGTTWSAGTEITVTTDYCTNINTTNTAYYLTNVSTAGGITNISQSGLTFPTNGYNYYSALSPTISQVPGGTFTVSVTETGGTTGIGIWVDWNQNGSFADAGDQMYLPGGYITSVTTGSLTVPAGATLGNTRMRIVASEAGTSSPTACTGSAYTDCLDYVFNVATPATPTITLSTNNIAAGNLAQGTTSIPVYSFAVGVTTASATLTGLNITTTGSYASADLTNLKVWYQTSAQGATFTGGGTLLSTLTTPGVAGIKTFPTFTSQTIANGANGYIFITADVPCAATIGNTLAVNAVTGSNTTFTVGTATGTPSAGNTQTVSAATPNNLVTRAASVLPTSTVITWTAPTGCYSDVMIVVSPAANTGGTPSGGAYSGASLTYGSGTAFGNGYIVYEGTTSSQTVTGLTIGNTYYVKFFTRNGTTWSSGTEIQVTTDYCANINTTNTAYYLTNVSTAGGITNISQSGLTFPTNGYNYYSALSPTISQVPGGTFTVSVTETGGTTGIGIWVDWNQNGSFADAGDQMYLPGGYITSVTTGSLTVPAGATLGNTRMRIVASEAGTSSPTACTGSAYTDCLDYVFNVATPVTPTIALSTNNVAAGNLTQNTTSIPVYSFAVGVTTASATLTGLNITTTGSYASADLTNLKVWYQTSAQGATFTGTGTLLSTLTTPGAAGTKTFSTFTSQAIANGANGYIFITADVPCAATIGNTLAVNAVTGSNTTFTAGTATGTPSAGNTQTVVSSTPVCAASQAASTASGQSVLTWTAPTGCYSDVMIVVSPAANTGGTPSGGAYSGASLTYGSGTAFGNGYIVYEGTTSSQTVTGLTNGNTYYVKFFTRWGNVWTACTEFTVTPAVTYCASTASSSTAWMTSFGISGGLTGFTNTSGSLGYTYYSGVSASQNAGSSVNFSMSLTNSGIAGTSIGIWIDLNQDGIFQTAENLYTTGSTQTTSTTPSGSFTIPALSSSVLAGNTRMRVVLQYTSGVAAACNTTLNGETEDYVFNVVAPVTPTITLSDNIISAGNISQGTTSNPIYSFAIAPTVASATLSGLSITTTGSYVSADVTNLKAWYQTSAQGATFTGSGTLLSTLTTPGVAGSKTFPSFVSQVIANGATGYIFITADIPCAATVGNNIAVNAVTGSNTTFALGTATGTLSAGNTQTVIAATPNNLTTRAASTLAASTNLTWTAPTGCYNDIMIVVSPAANTGGTPSGGAYTGASLTYGGGTAFGNGYIVYEGTTSSQLVTGLTNGNTYYVKFFTRNGTNWSSGTEITVTPTITYCTTGIGGAASCTTGSFNSIITNVAINTLSNSPSCNSAADSYTSVPTSTATTSLAQGASYSLSVTCDAGTTLSIVSAWIDFNQNGTFDATEWVQVYTNAASGSVSIAVPATATLGQTTMRIRSRNNASANGSGDACTSFGSGMTVDYKVTIVAPCLSFSPSSPSVCLGSSVSVTVSGGTSYSWSTGASTATVSLSPTTTTIYSVTPTGACTVPASVTVTVNPVPTAVTVTPATATICSGSTQALAVTGGLSPGFSGSPAASSGTTAAQGNPYRRFYGGSKLQFIYTASELTSAGLTSGAQINSLAFNVTSVGGALPNINIGMMLTSSSTFSSSTLLSGLTSVYSSASTYTPVSGSNPHTLSSPFTWDGSSNLLVEVCFADNSAGSSSSTVSTVAATAGNTVLHYTVDNTPGLCSTTPTGTLSTARPFITLGYSKQNNITWNTNMTDLYTNSGATTSYTTNTAATSVWAKPTATQTYTATSTSANGCTAANTSVVTVNTPSTAPTSISGTALLCNGTGTTLTATGGTLGTGATYQWGTGASIGTSPIGGATSSTYTVTPSGTTTYWVSVTGATPCGSPSGGASQTVTVHTASTAPTSITGSTTICSGGGTTLTASGGSLGTGATYQWGTGSSIGTNPIPGATSVTYSVTPSSSTTYWVSVTGGSTCGSPSGGATQLVNVIANQWLGGASGSPTDWNNPANWCSGLVPTATTDVYIPSTANQPVIGVSATTSVVANNITLNTGAVLTMANNSTLTISAGAGYSSFGSFAAGNGKVVFAGAGSVSSTAPVTFYDLEINGTLTNSATTTIGNSLVINSGNLTNAPIYGAVSTLVYNTSYGRYVEWNATGAGTIGSTPGYPNNVTIATGTLDVNNGANVSRALAGTLTINSGATLAMNTMTASLIVAGNVINNGTLSLSSASGGDIYVAGNWTKGAAATFNPNNRAVFMNGSGTQVVSVTGGGTETFNYLVTQGSGTTQLSSSPATDVVVSRNGGLNLGSSNATSNIDLNGQTLTLSGGGNLTVNSGNRSITSSIAGGALKVTSSTVSVTNGGTLTFETNTKLQLQSGFNFGFGGITTIKGILQIDANGFGTQPPTYASTSTLVYNTGGSYTPPTNGEWNENIYSQPGVPYNVTISNSGTNLNFNGRGFPHEMWGNLNIGAGTTLTLNSVTSGADFNIKGNWTNAGTFNPGIRQVQFNGTSVQSVTGATTFDYFKMNNSAGLLLNDDITVNNVLNMTAGVITTGSHVITISNAASGALTSYGTSSYVNGNLWRYVTGGTLYAFPLGTATSYEPATLNLVSQTGMTYIKGSFTAGLPATGPSGSTCLINKTPITSMLNAGYWTLTPDAYTAANYDITLNQSSYSNSVPAANYLGVIKRHDASSPWLGTDLAGTNGYHSNANSSISGGVASAKRTGVTTFSDFGIGVSGSYALPVELIFFTAEKKNNDGYLTWATASEINNDHFDVERSIDGVIFQKVGEVAGHGNSSQTISYDYTDANIVSLNVAVVYYRLKQVDVDGAFEYSNIAAVDVTKGDDVFHITSMYPNPFADHFTLAFYAPASQFVKVSLYDVRGALISEESVDAVSGLNVYTASKLDHLASGFYTVNVNAGLKNYSYKIVKGQ